MKAQHPEEDCEILRDFTQPTLFGGLKRKKSGEVEEKEKQGKEEKDQQEEEEKDKQEEEEKDKQDDDEVDESCLFNRPGVAGAVLQSPPSLIN